MKKDEIMTWLIVAAGGLAVWWYLNNYGPNGAIATYGGTSFWTQWFGGTAAATTTTGTGTATPTSVDPNPGYDYWNPATGTWVATAGTGIAPTNLAPAGTAVTVPASTSTTSTATITEPMAPPSSPGATALITASSGQTALDADEWNFYWGQVTGVTQTANLYPPTDRTALMSAQDYINARTDAGLNTTPTNAAETGGTGTGTPVSTGISTTQIINPYPVGSLAWDQFQGANPTAVQGVSGIVQVTSNRAGVGTGMGMGMGMSFGGGRGFSKWKN